MYSPGGDTNLCISNITVRTRTDKNIPKELTKWYMPKIALDQPGVSVISKSQATMVQNNTCANGMSSAMLRNRRAWPGLRVDTAWYLMNSP